MAAATEQATKLTREPSDSVFHEEIIPPGVFKKKANGKGLLGNEHHKNFIS